MDADPSKPGPLLLLAGAAVFVSLGLFLVLTGLGIIAVPPEALKAPLWIIALSGIVFMCAGGFIAVNAARGANEGDLPATAPFALRLAQQAFPLAMLAALGIVAAWIAFGDGPREFTSQSSFLGVTTESAQDETSGRRGFGAVAILAGIVFVFGGLRAWRKLRPTPTGSVPPPRR